MNPEVNESPSPATVGVLVANHARFLAFLKPRVGSTEAAEEILQAAFVKGARAPGQVRPGFQIPHRCTA